MARIYAHRGASGYAPENTFAAFDLALVMQADGIETDVRATHDGHLVLLHDERIDRTTDGVGPVAAMTLADLKRVDAGGWFAPRYADERVPTVRAFLDRYGARTHFWLEIKALGVERTLAQLVLASGHADRVQCSSFRLESLRRMRAAWPQAHLTWLLPALSPEVLGRARELGLAQLSIRAENLTEEVVHLVHEAGMEPRAWGVADRKTLQRMLSLDLYGLTLNWPDWAERKP